MSYIEYYKLTSYNLRILICKHNSTYKNKNNNEID